MKDMTPSQIVKELDKYIIGQEEAKKSVAIALRNRYRRRLLPEKMKDEITPRNIIMMGPTGVGKTEIARRLAKLLDAPFIKVEATKFTEVGYVGRDVESMIRDLVNTAIRLVKQREIDKVSKKTESIVNDRLLDAIVPVKKKQSSNRTPYDMMFGQNNQKDVYKRQMFSIVNIFASLSMPRASRSFERKISSKAASEFSLRNIS